MEKVDKSKVDKDIMTASALNTQNVSKLYKYNI